VARQLCQDGYAAVLLSFAVAPGQIFARGLAPVTVANVVSEVGQIVRRE
jgi:hypothetical protein